MNAPPCVTVVWCFVLSPESLKLIMSDPKYVPVLPEALWF